LAFLQPGIGQSIVGQSELRKALAHAMTHAQQIVDNDKRNLWSILIQLIDVLAFQTIS